MLWSITLLSFDLWRNYYIKNVVLFEDNSILPLPECVEASGVKSVWGEVSQESPKNRGKTLPINRPLIGVLRVSRSRGGPTPTGPSPSRPSRGSPRSRRSSRSPRSRHPSRSGRSLYPVVIITCVHYLGPPVPFSFPDSRDLLEVLRRTSLAEREPPGRIP